LIAAFAALVALGPAVAAGAAGPVFPKGMRVGLAPPGDFKPSKHFPGFEDAGRDARITILELPPRAFQKIERSVFAKTTARSQRGEAGKLPVPKRHRLSGQRARAEE
jgi:hypothetical protein